MRNTDARGRHEGGGGGGHRRHARHIRLFHQASPIVTPHTHNICYVALVPAALTCSNTDISWPDGKLSQVCMGLNISSVGCNVLFSKCHLKCKGKKCGFYEMTTFSTIGTIELLDLVIFTLKLEWGERSV